MSGAEKLEQIAARMTDEFKAGAKAAPERVKVRDFVGWFGYQKRVKRVVSQIRNKMEELNLQTVPDFEFAWIDKTISIEFTQEAGEAAETSEGPDDPTVRIGALEAANQQPTAVKPNDSLVSATTLMDIKNYSHLPVMTTDREVKGVVSWKSIGSRLSLGRECQSVRHCMDPARVIGTSTPLLDAIADISEHGYVLVRGTDNTITGIVTASDVVHQFAQLASPFLVIGEIEGHLRRLVYKKFTIQEFRDASLNNEGGRSITGSADLTFGDYCRLLQNREYWGRLELSIDRVTFTQHLDAVREIRNDVMHFDPDGLEPEHETTLKDLARFFPGLVRMGAI
ncbi:MAG: CBS domain-containing protein [Chloroflexi bacterium]|nr:CBS domain-containing protein [Chloroflexota bacterium]MCY3939077.1 CBS domain-containing protein [Chloroflexota bacterium]